MLKFAFLYVKPDSFDSFTPQSQKKKVSRRTELGEWQDRWAVLQSVELVNVNYHKKDRLNTLESACDALQYISEQCICKQRKTNNI